jgi:hypothetical protein
MFEQASRLRLRFGTERGQLSVEELWQLPLTGEVSLDAIAIELDKQTQSTSKSFVNPEHMTDPVVQLRFDIVQHVILVRLAEKKKADEARETAAKKQKLLGILARREDAELEGSSPDELRRMIAEL